MLSHNLQIILFNNISPYKYTEATSAHTNIQFSLAGAPAGVGPRRPRGAAGRAVRRGGRAGDPRGLHGGPEPGAGGLAAGSEAAAEHDHPPRHDARDGGLAGGDERPSGRPCGTWIKKGQDGFPEM